MIKAYIAFAQKQNKKKAKHRSSELGNAMLAEKFPGKGYKVHQKRYHYRGCAEYRRELQELCSKDEEYQKYIHGGLLPENTAFYNENREWIERMASEGLRSFSAEEVAAYRKRMSMVDHVPENIVDLYPAARVLNRKFVLHIGPTNSGKTYHAMQALMEVGGGIYLGPLRLLAFEQYERITGQGYACDLVTGEEELHSEGATFQASTIDVLNFETQYKCAVIDEAQMMTDEFRGGRWTSAIMGILAETIHVCAAPEAENILKQIIKECGDEYEVIRHKRLSALECDRDYCNFPNGIEKGDALIVFSRRSVHAVAAELQRRGYKCSVIYGALPYDVRHEESRKFAEKETDVVVATDAIGMGLNLPIRRVILMETNKFDGVGRRELRQTEIKQIVGRAGRAGIFDKGFYTVNLGNELELPDLKAMAESRTPALDEVRIGFPKSLLGLEGKVSELLEQWDNIPVVQPFVKASVEREIKLAKMLELYTNDKELIYELITIPYDETRENLLQRWHGFAITLIRGQELHFNIGYGIDTIRDGERLKEAEGMYEALDLEYQLSKKYGDDDTSDAIMQQKSVISEEINRYLAKQALNEKTCSVCGRTLSWDYPYGRCAKCHKRMIRRGWH